MDGVEPRRAWDLYLALEGDFTSALCAATLGWIRQSLISEAVALGQPGLIGLFRRDPRQIRGTSAPTLAEFSARFQDAGDFSEAELLALWKDEFGGRGSLDERRERLTRRLRDALQLLEEATRQSPSPDDPLQRWLAPALAERLTAAGLATLADVRRSLDSRRSQRWEAVPGVGHVWAQRVVDWLDDAGIDASIAPLVASDSQLVPLERMAPTPSVAEPVVVTPLPAPAAPLPSPYDVANTLNARNDMDVVRSWLEARARNPHTLRSYRKNAERLLLWCRYERHIGLLSLSVEDCIHYRTWLTDLGRKTAEEWAAAHWKLPQEAWIGPRAAARESPAWRPFAQTEEQARQRAEAAQAGRAGRGVLSSASVAQDLLVVRALYDYMVKAKIVSVNPWDFLGKEPTSRLAGPAAATMQFTSRSFTQEEWKFVSSGLDAGAGERPARLLCILWLGYACGLRASEMLSLTMGSILPAGERWRLLVIGKGNKARVVPLPSPARAAMLRYLETVGVSYDDVLRLQVSANESDRNVPILRGQRGRRGGKRPAPSTPLDYVTLHTELKSYLRRRAEDLRLATGDAAAGKLRRASAHWLRHTCATLALKSKKVDLKGVQQLLGHASITTTQIYVTESDDALQDAMERFVAGD